MERMDDLRHCLLEFLIRSPFPDPEEKDNMVKNMLRVFSMSKSNHDSGFKRIFLLKIIQNDLSSPTINISENILKILEHLEELFLCDAFPVPATLSAAYCAVAVECTIRYLHLNLHHDLLYLRAVKRIWQVRIPHQNSSGSREGSLPFSVELEQWKKDIETSLSDSQMRKRLASIDTRGDAIIKLRAFFDEACTVLGSPFAQLTVTEHTNKAQENEERGDCIYGKMQALAKDSLTTTMEDNEETYLSCSTDISDDEVAQVKNAARVDEEDSEDNLQGGTSRFNLRSPNKKKHSPLKIYKSNAFTKRRKTKRWSHLEEETLKNGVEKFGRGNWKLILNAHKDIFEERTEVNLKDKWRNITRYGANKS
ncbi:uncharacterized protein LOC106760502 [Vigna radiata var. radiata]|uniref:Uncharacterized protein LOC106760502 n=1 Tax=Vigna radiata var. radiata TaxID=3916 RepID=A0A1S3U075_VIGRR|nr:uncharacterized protein LOC106760502 [Vigna radiata var. radiata]